MSIIESTILPAADAYQANRAGMLALIARLRDLEARTRAASAAAKERFHKRGQLLPREIRAPPFSNCRRWPATCSTFPTLTKACRVVA
jgi:hypothetical protein